jgi:V/A-type H+-transporting ATPase subunit D
MVAAPSAIAMATRTELLALRAEIVRAREGKRLLGDKRAQLLEAFRKVADTVIAGGDALADASAASRAALALAEGMDGREAVASAALASVGEITVEAKPRAIMGVRFAAIERAALGRARNARGYSLSGSSAHIDLAAACFEAELELLIKIAAEELRLRRLSEELRKVSRRVNALEHVIIPALTQALAQARATLEERDREDAFRRRRSKRRTRGERLP